MSNPNEISITERRCIERWYPLKDHPEQLRLINSDARFKVIPAGRRSGKTERFKRYITKQAMCHPGEAYFIGAPTRPQVKRIFWEDIKLLTFASLYGPKAISESELTIRFPNEASITLIGLDEPARIEGSYWAGGGIDEFPDIKEDAWDLNIGPALDTYNPKNPDYKPWCWLFGVPQGLDHFYRAAERAKLPENTDWDLFWWKSADILPPEVIEAARRRMSSWQFRQEYEASFETTAGRIYGDYGIENTTTERIQPHECLLWMHDFNYTPLSSAIGVIRGNDKLYLLDEIVLVSGVARQSAEEFVHRFKDHQNRKLLLFGDPAGRAGEKHGHASDYTEIERVLRQHGWQVERKVKAQAPRIIARQNAVRAKILNAMGERSLFVNPKLCEYCHEGLGTVQVKQGSSFLEDEGNKYQHIGTAIGYCVDYLWPVRPEKEEKELTVAPSLNYWNKQLS